MSDRPDTWMPIYWGDYAKDTGHLSAAHHGAYLMLIKHYWVTGTALPDDDSQLWRIACADSLPHWRKLRAVIVNFFDVSGGAWHHARVEAELTLAAKRKAKAKHAAGFRWGNTPSDASSDAPSMPEHPPSICSNGALHHSSSLTTNLTEERGALTRSGTRLPEGWTPSPEDRTFAEQHGKNPDTVAASFRDYWRGVAGAKGRKADWPATWRNWIRRENGAASNSAREPMQI